MLSATPVSAKRIQLSWDSVPNATKYIIYRGTSPGNTTAYTTNSPETATTFLDTGLTPATLYCYVIRAYVPALGLSDPSPESCATTESGPGAPTLSAQAVSARAIQLTWTAVANADQYQIFRVDGATYTGITSVAAPTTSFTVSNLAPSTTYTFAVRAVTGQLIGPYSNNASATTFPEGLEGYFRFDERTGTVATDRSGYGRNGTLSGGAAFITTDQAPLKDENDKNPSSVTLGSSTAVINANIAKNFADDTTVSVWVKPLTVTGTMSIVGRRAAGCGPVSWLLYHNTSGLFFQGASQVVSFGQALPLNVWSHVAVTFRAGTLKLFVNGVQVGGATFNAGTVANSGVPLQIGNVGGCGNGGTFRVDEFQIWSRELTPTQVAAEGDRPPAPTVSVTEQKSNRITIGWTAVAGASHYYVYKGTAPGNATFLTTTRLTTFTWGNQTPNSTTYWRVLAVRDGLLSDLSNEVSATTLAPPPAPTGVTAVISTCCTPKRVDVSWQAADRAVRYFIYRSTDGGSTFARIGQVNSPTLKFQDSNVSAGNTYVYRVTTVDDGNAESAPSNTATITVP